MSNYVAPSIETLPVEILHRIFDNLDAQIILYSIRPLSKLFRSVVNTYNRYVLEFNLISKSCFYFFCRLIHPQNIISLTLSNNEQTSVQIDLFISLVHLRQITRLRSLTLLQISEDQLNYILKRINLNLLITFSFSIRKYDDRRRATTITPLSSIIAQSTLRKLEFNTFDSMPKISWPIDGITEYLTTNNRINIDDLCKIFQCSPHLHMLIMNEIPAGVINNVTSTCFRQLTSLTMQDLRVTIDELESFLLLTSSLVYLKLIGGEEMLDGKRWEQFIQINLPQLDKFEFYFTEWKSTKQTLTDLELIIASFQTPFWIEHKKWFVTCEYECGVLRLNIISLYSIPICTSYMYYTSKSEKISLSTYPMMMNNDLLTMDNIKSLSLTLNQSTANDIQEKVSYSNISFTFK
ncbi:unnamed protein product [Rotaria sp. Silwood2]|nr:unnamed protein product [Rotaria sp. Silwood2]CAF4152178.1 unnamed protein product [Rotaria sp. Silwood2]